ncbi:MAG: hypothetical protein IIC83_10845, partial [Chloroflexi bacterium]|nr:hypothetical protein [Chloroflexota bacterium]
LIRDAIVFRNLLLSSPNVAEAVKRLAKYVPVGRKFIRTIVLLASFGNDGIKQNVIDRLEDFIDFRAHQHFWESMDRSICTDSIGCFLRSWQPQKDENGQYTLDGFRCLKNDPPPCAVPEFIENHRELLEEFVATAADHSRDNVAKSAQAFEGILAGSDVPFGERSNCYPISDTLIVLEADDGAEIYSTDGDVHAICEILGKDAYVEVSST